MLGGLAAPVGQLDQPGLIEIIPRTPSTGSPGTLGRLSVLARSGAVGDHVTGEPYRQARFADATGTAQGQGTHIAKQPGKFGEITLTADEAVRLRWQVAAQESGGGRHWPSGDLTLEGGNKCKCLTVPARLKSRWSVAGLDDDRDGLGVPDPAEIHDLHQSPPL